MQKWNSTLDFSNSGKRIMWKILYLQAKKVMQIEMLLKFVDHSIGSKYNPTTILVWLLLLIYNTVKKPPIFSPVLIPRGKIVATLTAKHFRFLLERVI